MLINEKITQSDFELIEDDVRTFLKNVNRLKSSDDFFELLVYYYRWYFDTFRNFLIRATGKGLPSYSYYEGTITGKQIKRLEDAMTGLFLIDNQDFKKYMNKVSNDKYVNMSAIAGITQDITDRRPDLITKDFDKDQLDEYFAIWSNNQSSRYISTKKRVDEVFEALSGFETEDKYIDHDTEYEGVHIQLIYAEEQYNDLLDTLGYVKSAIKVIGNNKAIKFMLEELSIIIDFVNPINNYEISLKSGKKTNAAGCYILATGEIYISKRGDITDDIISVVIHELGHRYYYEVMNIVERKEWEQYYNKVTNPNPINKEYLDMMKANFIDLLSNVQSKYVDLLRSAREDSRAGERESSEWKKWVNNYDDLNVNIYYVWTEYMEPKGNGFTDLANFLLSDKDFDLENIINLVKKQIKKEKINLYDGEMGTLTPAANRDIIDVYYEEITRAIERKTNNLDYSQLPSNYAGENPEEFFAEVFSAMFMRKVNTEKARKYNLLEPVVDQFKVISGLRESIQVKLINNVRDYHHKQTVCTLEAVVGNDLVGYVDYYLYEDEVHIDMIKVGKEYLRQGIGSQLIEWLIKEYNGYQNIWWGMTTEEGTQLKIKFDKKYGERKEANYHLDPIIIKKIMNKDKIAGKILEDFCLLGYEKTWDKLLKNDKEWSIENSELLNSLGDISEWIIGSATNNNLISQDVPDYIYKDIHDRFGVKE